MARLLIVPLLLALSGCMTAEEQRAADEARCRSYGFMHRNDAFAECMQRIDLARRAGRRSSVAADAWDGPVVVYRP
jgi:hypothetical protein